MNPWHMSWYGQTWSVNPLLVVGIGMIALVVGVLVIALKGFALWNAVKRDEKWWFVALLILNTMGILELIYLFFVVKIEQQWKSKEGNQVTTPPSTV